MSDVITVENIEDIVRVFRKSTGKSIDEVLPEIKNLAKPKETYINNLMKGYIDLFIDLAEKQAPNSENFKKSARMILYSFVKEYSDKLSEEIYFGAYDDHCLISVDAVEKIIKKIGINPEVIS